MRFGLDGYKIYCDIRGTIFVSELSLFVLQVSSNSEESVMIIEKMISCFIDNLISMIFGDAAGTFVSNIVKLS